MFVFARTMIVVEANIMNLHSDSMLKTKRSPLLTPASPPFDFAAAIDAKKQKLAESKKRLEELKALSRTQTIDLQGKPVNASFSERTMLFKMSERERKLQAKLAEEQERTALKLAQAHAKAAKAERDRRRLVRSCTHA
jgi:hypothetical protein